MKKEKVASLLKRLIDGDYVSRYYCKILLDRGLVTEEKIMKVKEKGRPKHKYIVNDEGREFVQSMA